MPAPNNRKLSAEYILDPDKVVAECQRAIVKARGNVVEASSQLGVSRSWLVRRVRKHRELRAAVREARNYEADLNQARKARP